MTEYPNPVLRSVLLRTLAPLVPVWLFGCVLALVLNNLGLVAGPVGLPRISDFLVVYSTLVLALLVLLAVYQYRSSPSTIVLEPDGVTGVVPRREGEGRLTFPYTHIRSLAGGDLFGYRVEGRPGEDGSRPLDWINLTPENAERVTAAWAAWRRRNLGGTFAPE
jgi:hypothetical protein